MSDRSRALAVLVAVFLLGCVVGAGGFSIWSARSSLADRSGRVGPLARRDPQKKLAEVLKLTAEQEVKFREIMAESRQQIEAVRKENAPKMEAIRSEMDKKLMAILNDDQKSKFEAFRKEMEQRRESMRRRVGLEPRTQP